MNKQMFRKYMLAEENALPKMETNDLFVAKSDGYRKVPLLNLSNIWHAFFAVLGVCVGNGFATEPHPQPSLLFL